ncbi:MAG: hypothetical protein ACLFWL_16715 [Candidatus Brocadiia bacterium]
MFVGEADLLFAARWDREDAGSYQVASDEFQECGVPQPGND